jgi:type VI protein secretion system component Hcp
LAEINHAQGSSGK